MIENQITCNNSELLKFDASEYTILDEQIRVESFDWSGQINQTENTYCFGPTWTEDEETIVKMKLFYCESGMVYYKPGMSR